MCHQGCIAGIAPTGCSCRAAALGSQSRTDCSSLTHCDGPSRFTSRSAGELVSALDRVRFRRRGVARSARAISLADGETRRSRFGGHAGAKVGAPYRIRTCGLRLRRPTLYPAELRARWWLRVIQDAQVKMQTRCREPNRVCILHLEFCTELARPAGLEPATYGFEVRRSIQLSYGRTSAHHSTQSEGCDLGHSCARVPTGPTIPARLCGGLHPPISMNSDPGGNAL